MYRPRRYDLRRFVPAKQVSPPVVLPSRPTPVKRQPNPVEVPRVTARTHRQLPDTEPGQFEIDSQQISQPVLEVWGRLYGKKDEIQSLDLNKSKFSAGRDIDLNDFVFKEEQFRHQRYFNHISKVHFVIEGSIDGLTPIYIEDKSTNGTFINGEENRIGKDNRRILMHGDEISVGNPTFKIFQFRDSRQSDAYTFSREVTSKYYVSELLGKGACGVVKMIYNIKTCEKLAMKEVSKSRVLNCTEDRRELEMSRLLNEVNIMNRLEHPCIMKLFETIDTPSAMYLVLEYMKGGDLLSRIISTKQLSEKTSKFYFYQLCKAVKYLHDHRVTHRDIKPDNILLMTNEEETLLKISDFGLSKYVEENSYLRTVCGTPMYVAPEILENKIKRRGIYTPKVDIWSCGVVLYTMLSGTLPFADCEGGANNKRILAADFEFDGFRWKEVTSTAKNLLRKILVKDADFRPSIEELLEEDWIDYDIRNKAKQIMGINEDLTLVESDIENVTLVNMNISDDADDIVPSPPKKRQRVY